MADCGATGSTIDRAARSFFGGNDAKTAVSLMGHVVGGSTQIPVPLAAPDSILLPTQSSSRAMNPIQHQQQHSQIPEHAHYAQQQQPQNQFAPRPMHMQQMAIHNQMMRQQQFQQQQQMQQMQMQAMLQQQQRQVQLQHQRQQQLLAQSVQQVMGESEEQQHQGHEGLVKGATIEDLAAAWAEAEADYEELEAAVNMAAAASAKDGDAAESEAYQFIHSAHEQDRNTARAKDWMNEGMQYFEAGDLDDAVRAFEMELQQNNPDNATAWKMLGRCHAENDQDREAIICLERAVDRDPYCLEARLALGVSYVNELNHAKALEHLKAWITHDPKYSELNIGDDMYGGGQSDNGESDFDEVQRLLLTALEFDSN